MKRVNPSSFHTVQRSIGSFSTYTAIFTYLVTSVVFTVLYLLSSNDSDRLGIVIEGRYVVVLFLKKKGNLIHKLITLSLGVMNDLG